MCFCSGQMLEGQLKRGARSREGGLRAGACLRPLRPEPAKDGSLNYSQSQVRRLLSRSITLIILSF